MFELDIFDKNGKHIGTFRENEFTEAIRLFNDFLQMKFSVKMRDKQGVVIKEQTVLQ